MIDITIEIAIENPKEIAEGPGSIFKLVPIFFLSSKVEEEIKKQLKKTLNESFKNELSKRGVDAEVSVN